MVRGWTVVKVPYGGGFSSFNISKPKGTRHAPKALHKEFIRQSIFMANNGVSCWNNVFWRNINLGIGRQNSINGWERMHKKVFKQSIDICSKMEDVLFLGGSHTITASTYLAVTQLFGREETGLILLDAHPDCCRKSYYWPVHSDWLRWLVANDSVFPENVLIIGLRQIEVQEKRFLDKLGIKYYRMDSINPSEDLTKDNLSIFFELKKLRKLLRIYLSIDIDVVSGAYAPGTGCPSPGGFTDIQFINLVKNLKASLPNLKNVDIVEINPLNWWRKRILRYDPTVDLGVKLIKEIIS